MTWRGRVCLMCAVVGLAWCVIAPGLASAQVPEVAPKILAPANRQVAWLDLDAPRAQILTRFEAPDYVTDVAVSATGGTAAIAVMRTPSAGSTQAGEILALDLNSLQLSTLASGLDANASLTAPQWSPDGSRVFFQREDTSVVGVSYAGGTTVQYPSRLEAVAADGTARAIVVDNARQPALSPDGGFIAFVRRFDDGPALIIRSLRDDSERMLISPGHFLDIVSPRFSPQGDRIAFMAPVSSLGGPGAPLFAQLRLAMHGVPWDVWTVSVYDGTTAARLASVGADDGTVSWSPDGAHLFVYGGTGSSVIDSATAETNRLGYVSGYGATSWVAH